MQAPTNNAFPSKFVDKRLANEAESAAQQHLCVCIIRLVASKRLPMYRTFLVHRQSVYLAPLQLNLGFCASPEVCEHVCNRPFDQLRIMAGFANALGVGEALAYRARESSFSCLCLCLCLSVTEFQTQRILCIDQNKSKVSSCPLGHGPDVP